MASTSKLQPWDRRPDESATAFAAFAAFLSLGIDRTLVGAARKSGKSKQMIGQWSKRHEWAERCARWEAEQNKAKTDAQLSLARQEGRDWAKRESEVREHEFLLGTKLMAKAQAMLEFPLARVVSSQDGKQVTVYPGDWSMVQAARMAGVGSELLRRASGLPNLIPNQPVGPDGQPLPAADPNAVRRIIINLFDIPPKLLTAAAAEHLLNVTPPKSAADLSAAPMPANVARSAADLSVAPAGGPPSDQSGAATGNLGSRANGQEHAATNGNGAAHNGDGHNGDGGDGGGGGAF